MRRILTTTPQPEVVPVDLYLNPFNAASAHHRPVGTGAVYAGDSDATTTALHLENFTYVNYAKPYGVTVLKATLSDPVRTIVPEKATGAGLPVTIHLPDAASALTDPTSDNVLVVVNAVNGLLYEFYQFTWNGGSPTAWLVRTCSASGPGHGTTHFGTSASGMSTLFGLCREWEFASTVEFSHVMQLAGRSLGSGQKLANNYVWPAISKDGFCNGVSNCIGAIPYGALFALPQNIFTDAYIDTLGLSALGKRLARQLRNYGAYFIDNAEGSPTRSDWTGTGWGSETRTQMQILYPRMRRITNNAQGQPASGGGSPIAPNTAYNA